MGCIFSKVERQSRLLIFGLDYDYELTLVKELSMKYTPLIDRFIHGYQMHDYNEKMANIVNASITNDYVSYVAVLDNTVINYDVTEKFVCPFSKLIKIFRHVQRVHAMLTRMGYALNYIPLCEKWLSQNKMTYMFLGMNLFEINSIFNNKEPSQCYMCDHVKKTVTIDDREICSSCHQSILLVLNNI